MDVNNIFAIGKGMEREEKLILSGILIVLILFGFADLSTYIGLLLMFIGLVLAIKKNGKDCLESPLSKPLFLLLIVGLISFINIVNIGDALSILGNLLEVMVGFYTAYYICKNKSVDFHRQLLLALLMGAAIIGFTGLYQVFFTDIRRIYSLLNNSNILGAYTLLLILPAFILLYLTDYRFKLLSSVISSILILNMLFSFSRSAFIGTVGTFTIFGILRDKKLLVIIVIILILSPFILPDMLFNRLESTVDRVKKGKEQRLFIWKNAWEMFKSSPVIGVGIGQYRSHYKIYENAPIKHRKFDHTHNIILQIASELGLLGLIVFGWLSVKILLSIRIYKKINNILLDNLIIALYATLPGFFIQEQFEFSLIDAGGITILTGILLGWYMALIVTYSGREYC